MDPETLLVRVPSRFSELASIYNRSIGSCDTSNREKDLLFEKSFAFVTSINSFCWKVTSVQCTQYFYVLMQSHSLLCVPVCLRFLIWQPLCVCPCLRARLEHCRRSARTRRSCWTAMLWTGRSTLWYQSSSSSSSTAAPRLGTRRETLNSDCCC